MKRRAIGDRSFDLVFSNSVIEHVGPPAKKPEFAHEVLRLGKSYWVQTPSKWFPLRRIRDAFLLVLPGMAANGPAEGARKEASEMVGGFHRTTRVLSRRRMGELFPNGRVHVEFLFGLPKSYVAYSPQ